MQLKAIGWLSLPNIIVGEGYLLRNLFVRMLPVLLKTWVSVRVDVVLMKSKVGTGPVCGCFAT